MNQISIAKAQDIGDQKAISTMITISEEIQGPGEASDWRTKWEETYKMEAENLFRALKQSLPQGTMHQLLILMLRDKQNLIVGV